MTLFDHPVVTVALGLAILYSTLSVLTSMVVEWIASCRGLRAKTLREGIERLFGCDVGKCLYSQRQIELLTENERSNGPSYIEPETVSAAFFEVVTHRIASVDDSSGIDELVTSVREKIEELSGKISEAEANGAPVQASEGKGNECGAKNTRCDENIRYLKGTEKLAKGALVTLDLVQARGAQTVGDARVVLARWFNEVMERAGGWYRRRTRVKIVWVGFVIAVTANASTTHVAQQLWKDESSRQLIDARAEVLSRMDSLPELDKSVLHVVPLGWGRGGPCAPVLTREDDESRESGGAEQPGQEQTGEEQGEATECSIRDLPLLLVGWAMTAAAVSLGAPFWFDTMSRLVTLRAAGRKPEETLPE